MQDNQTFRSILNSNIPPEPIDIFVNDPDFEYSFKTDETSSSTVIHKLSYKNATKVLPYFLEEKNISYNELLSLINTSLIIHNIFSKQNIKDRLELFSVIDTTPKPNCILLKQFKHQKNNMFFLQIEEFYLTGHAGNEHISLEQEKCESSTDSVYYTLLSYIDYFIKSRTNIDNYTFSDLFNYLIKESSYSFYSKWFNNNLTNVIHDEQFINQLPSETINLIEHNPYTTDIRRSVEDFCSNKNEIAIAMTKKENLKLNSGRTSFYKNEIISYLKQEKYIECGFNRSFLPKLNAILLDSVSPINISYILSIISLHDFNLKLHYQDSPSIKENFFVLSKKLVDDKLKNPTDYFIRIIYRTLHIDIYQGSIHMQSMFKPYGRETFNVDIVDINDGYSLAYLSYMDFTIKKIEKILSLDRNEITFGDIELLEIINY